MSINISNRRIIMTPALASGGSYSYAFLLTATANNTGGSNNNLFSVNLGTGSIFFIVAAHLQPNAGGVINSITINGTALTPIANNGTVGTVIYAGTATVTGSDTISVISSQSVAFLDTDICVWSASNLISTTPVSSSNGTASSSTVTAACSVGNFVFAVVGAGGTVPSFSTSAQAPTGIAFGINLGE